MQARTQLPPEPRSAAEARHWIRDHLTEIGRADLVPAAEAGVSELVTNGILHAQTSIGLQLTRSQERVIIEVYDGSPMVHQPTVESVQESTMESTIGRGLRIVRAYAREWGVATGTHGKAIWFQPAPSNGAAEPVEAPPGEYQEGTLAHSALDLDAALDALAAAFPEPGAAEARPVAGTGAPGSRDDEPVQVRLLGVPPWIVHHYRKRWLELVREMQLVALGEPSPQQEIARRFCRAAQAVEPDLYLIEHSATHHAAEGGDSGGAVDATFEVRPSVRSAYVEIREMAREMEKAWAGVQLLFVHPGEQAVQLREWWLGEFIGQLDGAEPAPWPGEMRVRDEALLSGSADA